MLFGLDFTTRSNVTTAYQPLTPQYALAAAEVTPGTVFTLTAWGSYTAPSSGALPIPWWAVNTLGQNVVPVGMAAGAQSAGLSYHWEATARLVIRATPQTQLVTISMVIGAFNVQNSPMQPTQMALPLNRHAFPPGTPGTATVLGLAAYLSAAGPGAAIGCDGSMIERARLTS